MKACIWKDPETGMWCYVSGDAADWRPTWEEAFAEVLAELDAQRAGRA